MGVKSGLSILGPGCLSLLPRGPCAKLAKQINKLAIKNTFFIFNDFKLYALWTSQLLKGLNKKSNRYTVAFFLN
ncbi:MAG: hypothetical protein DWP94_02190 [Flavobacterium sp.]|nr:MAG: hypothetical protein DWP94_02190 [Flavobacterium sp.]